MPEEKGRAIHAGKSSAGEASLRQGRPVETFASAPEGEPRGDPLEPSCTIAGAYPPQRVL